VLRLQAMDEIVVVDGKGGWYRCEITRPDARRCELRVLEVQTDYGKRPYSIHIALAPTKNADRTEWFVEKCVELGVDKISFLICEHSERRFFKTDRVEKIAIGAMKQSLKAFLPVINEAESFSVFINHIRRGYTQPVRRIGGDVGATQADQLFIAHLEEETSGERRQLQWVAEPNGDYCVLIGPEGDFSTKEINQAKELGFHPVSLGNSRLRTETAGIVACHLLHIIHQSKTN
jgi:16S rRNA (uracil1498-N3)-methyltransferase